LNGQTQYCIVNDSGGQVWDKDIYAYNMFGRSHFAFLWSCDQGDVIGQTYNGVPVGMPYAWTRRNASQLSLDGYTNATPTGFAFIGFIGAGPALDYDYGQGYYFAAYFYQCAFTIGKTLDQALDYAALRVWQCTFASCPYRLGFTFPDGSSGEMVIYGDGTLAIEFASSQPPDPPQCPLGGLGGGGRPGIPNIIHNSSEHSSS